MKIVFIGSGYVGLVSGVCFSDFGHDVVCVDKNQQTIDALNAGKVPIHEPGLEDLASKNISQGRHFTTNLSLAVQGADAIFIAVGTPTEEDGSADLSFIYDVINELSQVLNGYITIITKSTVPVGTNRR